LLNILKNSAYYEAIASIPDGVIMERSYNLSEILRPLIKLIVGIISLIFIKVLIAIGFPSFDEQAPRILTFIGMLGGLIVNTLILLLLLNFGREGRSVVNKLSEERFWGDVVFFTLAVITVGLAHWVYKDLFSMILGRYLYIYSLLFLVGAVILIVMLGIRIFKNLDRITGLTLEKIKGIPDLIRKIEGKDKKI